MSGAQATGREHIEKAGDTPQSVSEKSDEALRAQLYRFLANLLSKPASEADLNAAGTLSGDETAIGCAINGLAKAARQTSETDVAEQFQDLFIGIGRGEFVPFGSYYLTGFLHEKPLAKLRTDLAELGLARDDSFSEPEDHISAELETMACLIDGSLGPMLILSAQNTFFDKHLGSWAPHFFRDLSETDTSKFYAAVGTVGVAFMEIEKQAFAMS